LLYDSAVPDKFIEQWVVRIRNMSEAEVLRSLRSLESSRGFVGEALDSLKSASLRLPDDSEPAITQLHAQLSSPARYAGGPYQLYDYIEHELKQRLEQLRRHSK
jgi:hypothetical protein